MTVTEKSVWDDTKQLLGNYQIFLGQKESALLRSHPKELGTLLSRYKFAAKMACKNARVLELGCGEGIAAPFLAESAQSYLGVETNKQLLEAACKNLPLSKVAFQHDHFLGKTYGKFDAVVCFDVKETTELLATCIDNLSAHGILVMGCKTSPDFLLEMKEYFFQILPFRIHDEVVIGGAQKEGDYFIGVGCHRKNRR